LEAADGISQHIVETLHRRKKFPTAIFFSQGIFPLAMMSNGTKANQGRKGGERNEDHENSFVSFIFSRSYGFEHSIGGGG
jgi:hypothetical protein